MNAAAGAWLIYMTIVPNGIEYTYLQEFSSLRLCNEQAEVMRSVGRDAVATPTKAIDCTDVPPPVEGPRFFKPL